MTKKIKNGSGRKASTMIVTFFCSLLLLGSIAVIAFGIGIRSQFEVGLPSQFFSLTSKGLSPQFFCYRFEDRTNRIGEEELLSDAFFSQKSSIYVSGAELPQHVKDAFVSIEDKRFYDHKGVDWYRTAAACANYLLGFSDSFGASTVTQQLIKNLTQHAEATPKRKMQEILYALDLERTLDKSQILELYLNVIHFSEHCDGIGAAAMHYFSKMPQELSVAESATLAAIINNPSYYNPIRNPQNNLNRRNVILNQMLSQGCIDETQYREAVNSPLGLNIDSSDNETDADSWYADMVIQDVIHDLKQKYGMTQSAASTLLYSGGLKISVAVDPAIQAAVERYYESKVNVPVNEEGVRAQSALIVIDSHTGDVLGVAGAVGKKQGNRVQNFATQTLRSPGSALKPISVYAPALEHGLITWASVFDDVPINFSENGSVAWPKNASYGYRGLTDVAYAVAESTNTASVRVLQKLGLDRAFRETKSRFHIDNLYEGNGKTDRDLAALALGQLNYGVTLRELANAYCVFADGGVYHPWRSYYRVLDAEGRILLSAPDGGEVVMSEGNAAVMTKLLQGAVEYGSAASIDLKKQIECAGKTGTTNRDADRWFIGYTPDLVCGVWCGYEYPAPLVGKNACLKIWDDVMREIADTRQLQTTFSVPSALVRVSYCRDSGKIPCDACTYDPRGDRIVTGWFVKGTEPHALCDCHVLCELDAEHGGICHGNCPQESRKKVALIKVDRHFPIDVAVADAQFVYGGDPKQLSPNEHSHEAYFAPQAEGYIGHSRVKEPFNRSCTAHPAPMQESNDRAHGMSPLFPRQKRIKPRPFS